MFTPEPARIVWHVSSYSSNGGSCVEVGWHTSTHSTDNGDCVEVNHTTDDVLVRDTKNRPGPVLAFPATPWHAFLARV